MFNRRYAVWFSLWLLGTALLTTAVSPINAQCAVPEIINEKPDFDGVILTYAPDEGVRALRSTVATTYYIAFEGSNFTGAGVLSPDGKWFALPYGTIQTMASSDVRYRISELRIHSTEPVPRIAARMAWSVSYQVEDGIPPLRWLDHETLLLETGADYDLLQVNPFTQETTDTDLDDYLSLSPDATRGIARDFERLALFDAASGEKLQTFASETRVFAWTPDSASFVALEGNTLTRYTRDGETVDSLINLSDDQHMWNFRWSPDGSRYAYSLYDPYKNEHYLHTSEGETCIRLHNLHDGAFTSALAWSPDGSMLALTGYDNALLIYDFETLYNVAPYSGGLLGWGHGNFP